MSRLPDNRRRPASRRAGDHAAGITVSFDEYGYIPARRDWLGREPGGKTAEWMQRTGSWRLVAGFTLTHTGPAAVVVLVGAGVLLGVVPIDVLRS